MNISLQQRIMEYMQDVFKRREGAWLVWCDPQGNWGPILQRVAGLEALRDIPFISVKERTAGEIGSPRERRIVQEHIDAKKPFVLHIETTKDALGWLWAQVLLAEDIHTALLREKLMMWGWKPQSIHTSDEVVAHLALQKLHLDPADWGGDKIQLQPLRLLDILAGGAIALTDEAGNAKSDRTVLNLTIEEASLPELDEQDLERWRIQCVAHLLVTHVHHLAPNCIRNHELLIPGEKRLFALSLIDRWLDSLKLRKGLPERVLEADRLLSLGNFMSKATIDQGPFLSQAAEKKVFDTLCAYLATLQGRELFEALVPLYDALERHAQGFWGDGHEKPLAQAVPWGELARLSQAVKMLLDAEPRTAWAKPADAVDWYIKKGWQVERAGEGILRLLDRTTTELLNFIAPLREAYRNRWETYMIQWSELWSNAGCPLPIQNTQGEWLKDQMKGKRPTVVIVLDALRYDIGVVLKDQINEREGQKRAQVVAARTSLPTITALGMGTALPINEDELYAEVVSGKWHLYQHGQTLDLSIAENRREWLRIHYNIPSEALLSFADALAGNIPEPHEKRPYLFLFDATIDKFGHDEELEPLGTEQIQSKYITTIERLRDKGWERVLIVTDHGFIHWPGNVEHKVSPPPGAAYSSRRAMAYSAEVQLDGPQGLASGGKLRIAVPSGAACFRTYGGLSYVHGGASLQEWIIPCIKIEWPEKAKPVSVKIQSVDKILSIRQKIVLEVQHDKLFDETMLSRQVEVLIRDTEQQTVLFHVRPKLIRPEDTQVAVTIEPLEDVEAERNTKLTIELRDARTHGILDSQPSTLMVSLENW